jgi:hypothetical protein
MSEVQPTRIERAAAALRAELESCAGCETDSYLREWAKAQDISEKTLMLALADLKCRVSWSNQTASGRAKKFWSLP